MTTVFRLSPPPEDRLFGEIKDFGEQLLYTLPTGEGSGVKACMRSRPDASSWPEPGSVKDPVSTPLSALSPGTWLPTAA